MTKVIFCLFGNMFSSLMTSEIAKKLIDQEYGIKTIGESGFPVAICHHGMETEMFPFLLENPTKYENITTISSTFNHSLVGILNDQDKKFQIKNGVEGDTDVFFFPDFVNPRPNIIKEKFFLYLVDQREAYNPFDANLTPASSQQNIINFDNKIGIPIDGYKNFLDAWHKHAANPDKNNLNELFKQFEKICEGEEEFVIIPINFEQPFVGSVLGEKLWEIFFNKLSKHKYKDNVVPLNSILDYCEKNTTKKRPPSRVTIKWSYYQNQKQIFAEMNQIELPTDSKKYYKAAIVKSIAYLADYFTSIGRRTAFSEGNFPVIDCFDLDGKKFKIELKWNEELEAICLAARKALKNQENFSKTLKELEPTFLVETFLNFAQENKL